MKSIVLSLASFENRKAIHQYLAEELGFPEYYGMNLDALHDMLTSEISEPVHVCFNFEKLEDDDLRRYSERMLRVFRDAEEECPEILVTVYGYENQEN